MNRNFKESISVDKINKMSYTEFVGFINQWNVLPGAHVTLSKWKVFADINSKSNILEVACTTGFSSRELAVLTNCKGDAFDISEPSIRSAKENKKIYAPKTRINYQVMDGYKYVTKKKYTHIVLGAALKFFPKPQEMLNKCISMLEDGGYILAVPFYIKQPIPEAIIKEFESVFGIRPTTESYKDILKMYSGLEVIYEERNDLLQETEEELAHYCNSTIDRVCKEKKISDREIYSALYNRLLRIKEMSNKLRPYQGYVVLVLRYNSKVFPNRYVELF
jgi:2-polyprenyl-3-methyl-5-hydroxy-6-metoxy-1,4-benzoquinol methylase